MPGFELDLPKANMPTPTSVPKIPLGSVGPVGVAQFGESLQRTAQTGAMMIQQWNAIERAGMQQNAYTATMNGYMELNEADLTQQDVSQAEALADPQKMPTFAKDHLGWIKDKIKDIETRIPKDPYAQHQWTVTKAQYLDKRFNELRAMQTGMVVSEFESSLKRGIAQHEQRLASAQSLDELNAIDDSEVMRFIDQSQEAGVRNRVVSASKAEDNRIAAMGNFQRMRFNRTLELDAAVAGVQFRNSGMVRTEDLLRAIPSPDQRADMATLPVGDQEKLREAYKARVANVAKSFIYGGHANHQTVLALQEQMKWDGKTFDDLMNTATAQANNVHQAQERQYQEQKRDHEIIYSKATTNLWGKLFNRTLKVTDLEAAEKANIFAQHPDTFHALHQALKTLHAEDLGVNAEASLPEFLTMKLKIQDNVNSPDVQPEKWINSKMSLGQKSELYNVYRLWQDKAEKDPRLHSDEYESAKDHLQTITGGKTASYNGKPESLRMLKLQGQVLHTFALDVMDGMEVNKAFKKARDYVELQNKAMSKPVQKSVPPTYVPPTNEQIEKKYPNPNDPRRYDMIEERARMEELRLLEEEERKKQEAEAAAQDTPGFWNGYGLFK